MAKEKIGEKFIRETEMKYCGLSDQIKGLPQPPLEKPIPEDAVLHKLPMPPSDTTGTVLFETFRQRRSIRTYKHSSITLKEFSDMLWAAQGVLEVHDKIMTIRTVPSAGARHALETYILINRIEDLDQGLYRYSAINHSIFKYSTEHGISAGLRDACLGQSMISSSAFSLFWAADIYRMTWRYGERGYRYIFLDAGHACQNLYLAGVELGIGVCAIAAFDDDKVNETIGLDGQKEFVIYAASAGRT